MAGTENRAFTWGIFVLLLFLIGGVGFIFNGLNGTYVLGFLVTLIFAFSPGIPFGIAGAILGKFWRKPQRATWIGAVVVTILGSYISVLVITHLGWDPFAGF